ncbi:MAG: hypothetical protein L6R40_004678 [Gallowayella cf. fulva]|nr:MAG: hypothetical protein L6R40_004678 [Xanthomendoza cf. fulva]
MFYDGSHFFSQNLENSPDDNLPDYPFLSRGRRWPSPGRFHAFRCTEGLWNDQESSLWGCDGSQDDIGHDAWPQHSYSPFNRAQSLDYPFLNHTHFPDPPYRESDGAGFRSFERDFRRRERRGHRQTPCSAFYNASPRFNHHRAQQDPRFPFDADSSCEPSGDNGGRRRSWGEGDRAAPGYKEPDDDNLGSSLPLPHRTGCGSRNRVIQYAPGILDWDVVTIAGTEGEARSPPRTLSPSEPSDGAPHAAAPPPSPHINPMPNGDAVLSGAREDSPSSTPSRHPSSPRSPQPQGFPGINDNQPQVYDGEMDLSGIFYHLRRQNRRLKAKRARLERFQSDLVRRAEALRSWEVNMQEWEARRHSEF